MSRLSAGAEVAVDVGRLYLLLSLTVRVVLAAGGRAPSGGRGGRVSDSLNLVHLHSMRFGGTPRNRKHAQSGAWFGNLTISITAMRCRLHGNQLQAAGVYWPSFILKLAS